MPLSSALFTTGLAPTAAARLEQVLAGRQPLKLNERSEAVRLLQTALIALGHPIPDGPTDFFGRQTETAVRAFQGRHAQKHGAPDGVVGPVTLGLIDLGLLADIVKPQQFFVYNFEGNPNQTVILDDDVLPISSLKNQSIKINISRRGLRTTNINSDIVKSFMDIEAELLKTIASGGFIDVRIYIIGSSAGGRLALTFAEKLTAKTIPIRYVGVTDAAFFNGQMLTPPKSAVDRLPTFTSGPITADIRKNYFQTHGNSVKLRRGLFWSSTMPSDEVHGEVLGFSNPDRNLDRDVSAKLTRPVAVVSDLDLHITCNQIAIPRMQGHVVTDLDGGSVPVP